MRIVIEGDSSDERVRVLFVIGTMDVGGAERQVIEILRRLDRDRFEPLLYLAMKRGDLLSEVPADVPIMAFWDGSPESTVRRWLRSLRLTRIVRYFSLARTLRRERIDVIYDRTFLATLDTAGACWLRPTARLSCCVADPKAELNSHARFSRRLSYWFARWAYASATVVSANSEGLRERLIAFFSLDPRHVTVCRNILADPDPPAAEQAEVSESQSREGLELSAASDQFVIVAAGRLHPEKGYRFLLEAVDTLVHQQGRRLKLAILGQGELMSELQQYVASHDLQQHVHLAGLVRDPRTWYRKANLFVLPSLNEGCPNALIEAAACGLPALAADCQSGPREILDGGRCGRLVPPGDTAALVTGIADAMDHEDEWKQRATLAQQWVRTMFDPTAGIRRVEDLLTQIAHRRHSRTG